MVSLDWQLDRTGEVTLVELTVRSEFDQRVRIESELTPVWPPRQHGTPLEGWNDAVFEGDVGQDNPLVLGYATPAEPTDPPATIAATVPPSDDERPTPREIVQTLGEGSPPRDTLAARGPSKNAGTDGTASRTPTDSAGVPSGSPVHSDSPGGDDPSTKESVGNAGSVTPGEPHTPQQPTAWLDAVESRLSTVETLARTNDADEARKAVTALGGIDDVRALQAQLDADRRHLEELQSRSTALTEQLSAVELPLATLERIV